jgi:nucleoside-diphosphate-sugar epimerase
LNLERRRRFKHCEVPAKPNDLNALQKLLFYLASSRFPRKDIDMQITHGQPRLGDVRRNFSDTSKAREVLGWKSRIGLEEGISKVVEWFSGV